MKEKLRFGSDALFNVADSLMKYLPDQSAQPMRDGRDRGFITHAREQAPEHCLEVSAFTLSSGMSCLVQHTSQVFVAFCRTATGVLFGTFFLAGTGSHPGSELGRRRKRACRYSCFSDDLLRRINAQTGHFRQPDYRILVRFHGLRDQAVQLCDLIIKQLQSLQFEGEHLPVHRVRASC